jgi:hypothetical protein
MEGIGHTITTLEDGSIRLRQYLKFSAEGSEYRDMIIPAHHAAWVGTQIAYEAMHKKEWVKRPPVEQRVHKHMPNGDVLEFYYPSRPATDLGH